MHTLISDYINIICDLIEKKMEDDESTLQWTMEWIGSEDGESKPTF